MVNASFGFIWPELNRFALRLLVASTPADYPGRPWLVRNRPTVGPALYMLNGHEVASFFQDVDAFQAALAKLLSGAYTADTLADAVDRATRPGELWLESHRTLIPAALMLRGRHDACGECCGSYLASLDDPDVRAFYAPYYAPLSRSTAEPPCTAPRRPRTRQRGAI